MIEFIYLIAILSVALLIAAIVLQIRTIGIISGMAMTLVGVAFITQGVGVTQFTNFFVRSTGVIFMGIGWFVLILGSLEFLDASKE